MTLDSERWGGDRIAADWAADCVESRQVDLSHDAGRPMRYLEIVSAALEEERADRQADRQADWQADWQAESAATDEHPGRAEVDLGSVLADSDSDAVQAEVGEVESEATPVAADAVSTASYAAARLLEIATRNGDALVDDARARADQMVAQARAHAEQVIQSSLADAKAREEMMVAREEDQRLELERFRAEALRDLEERRVELDAKVSGLAEFESRYRDHLIAYLSDQVQALQGPAIAEGVATDGSVRPHTSRPM